MTKLFPSANSYIQSWFQEPLKITTFFEYGNMLSKATNNPICLYAGIGLGAVGTMKFSINSIANITGVIREKNHTAKAEMIEQLEDTGEILLSQSYNSIKHLVGWSVVGLAAQAASQQIPFIGFSLVEKFAFSNAKIHGYNIFISATIAGAYGVTVNFMNMTENEINSRINNANKAASSFGNTGSQASKYIAQKIYEAAAYLPKIIYKEASSGDLHKSFS